MKGRRVAGLAVVSAIAIIFAAGRPEVGVSAQQDAFAPPQNSAALPPNAIGTQQNPASPPELLPPQNAPPSPEPAPEGTDPNTEVLTRGAIHEAFAQPVVFNPAQSPVVPKQPPEPVEEMPPEQKPAGDHVVWIAGYWSYEGDQQKFAWASGIWRARPAGVEWVPGYWTQADGGSQWVSGFWRKSEVTQVTYLPQKPPDTLEQGPGGVAPNPDYVWIPGHWVWWHEHYAWRPGFWAASNPNWIWVPAHYVWTPPGYVFVEGHWDYTMDTRGVIFAPVVFRPGFYVGPGFGS